MNEVLKTACDRLESKLVDDIETFTKTSIDWFKDLRLGTGNQTYAQQAGYNTERQKPAATAPPGGKTWGGPDSPVGAGVAEIKKAPPAPASAPNSEKPLPSDQYE